MPMFAGRFSGWSECAYDGEKLSQHVDSHGGLSAVILRLSAITDRWLLGREASKSIAIDRLSVWMLLLMQPLSPPPLLPATTTSDHIGRQVMCDEFE